MLDAKIKEKELVDKSNISNLVKKFDLITYVINNKSRIKNRVR